VPFLLVSQTDPAGAGADKALQQMRLANDNIESERQLAWRAQPEVDNTRLQSQVVLASSRGVYKARAAAAGCCCCCCFRCRRLCDCCCLRKTTGDRELLGLSRCCTRCPYCLCCCVPKNKREPPPPRPPPPPTSAAICHLYLASALGALV
jgi:hypothetical protein